MWGRVSSHFQFKGTASKDMEMLKKAQYETLQQMKISVSNEKLRGKPDKVDPSDPSGPEAGVQS